MKTEFRSSAGAGAGVGGEADVVRLCAELLAAAGPQRILGPMALRRVLTGADRTLHAEALSRALGSGVQLPPEIAEAFGLDTTAPATTTAVPAFGSTPAASGPSDQRVSSEETHPAPQPRQAFALSLPTGARLDFGAFDVAVLVPGARLPELQNGGRAAATPVPSSTLLEETAVDLSTSAISGAGAPPEATPTADFDSLKHYRRQIGRRTLLDRARERELARAIEAGVLAQARLDSPGARLLPRSERELKQVAARGGRAYTEFCEANLRLVVSIASRYQGHGLDLLDLIQEGNCGLLHAIEMFDHERGLKFSTYATHWIRQSVRRAIADKGRAVRIPVHAQEEIAALHAAARELGLDAPHDALADVASRAGTTTDQARSTLGRVRETVSLQSLLDAVGDEGLQEVADRALAAAHGAADADRHREAVAEEVGAAIDDLTPREMLVLTLRHGLDGDEPLTLDAVGRRLGVTRERVRQIEKKATERVRDLIVARGALDLPAGATAARATRRPASRRPPQTAPTPAPRPLRPAAPPHPRPRPSAAPVPNLPPVDGPVPGTTPGLPRPVTVRRRVHGTGQIMVESQSIDLGPAFRGRIVSVVVDDELYRVIVDGRQVTTARRCPSLAGRRIYGAYGAGTPA